MSGIFGVITGGKYNSEKLATKMAKAMCHREWYVSEIYEDRNLALSLGRIGIGIFNPKSQPVWNDDHTVGLFMAGEFINPDFSNTGVNFMGSNENRALLFYEKYGKEFPRYFKGSFIVTILDLKLNRVIIANDRFGLYPTYYTTQKIPFLFAPEIKGILCDTSFEKRLDLTALAQYMRFQHLLGTRTFFENIELLPNASVLEYDLVKGEYTINSYWSYQDIPYQPEIKFTDAVEEAGRLLRASVERLSGDAHHPGVFLSGGLDSRTILGLSKTPHTPSVTWGPDYCRDVKYARRIAHAVGSENHWFDLSNGKWVEENVDFHLDITEGFHSWIHSHGINVLPDARQWMDVILTGWDGGTIMGHYESGEANIELIRSLDEVAMTSFLFSEFNQNYTWPSITETEESFLYTDQIYQKVSGLAFESFESEFSKFQPYRKELRPHLFFLANNTGRLTKNMVTLIRSHMEVRFPYFDYDLFDFLFSLPVEIHLPKKFFRSIIDRELPRLAFIPYEYDHFLPTSHTFIRNTHALSVRILRRMRKVLGINSKPDTLYADYENYLRSDLKSWGESILFHPSVKEHGIFNPSFISSIWNRHQSGMEQWTIGKIAPIMTYEMMLRRFMD